ncbi:MAG: helix-turn-helix transcriptional regulator [bacterium]
MKNLVCYLRTNRRMTQEDLAKEIGVSRQTINTIENEKNIPTLELAYKISLFFGLTIEEVFDLKHNIKLSK